MIDERLSVSPSRGRSSAGIRVLHVVSSTQRRGAETFAADLIRDLGSRNVDQRVAVLDGSDAGSIVFDAPSDLLGSSPSSYRRPAGDLIKAVRLRRLARRWRPSVVQAHGGQALKTAALARLGCPIVYRRIGCAPEHLRHGWRRVMFTRLLRRASTVVAVADAVASETVDLFGVAADRVLTIPNAVDVRRLRSPGRSDFRAQLGIPSDSPLLLSLGALTWEKDPEAHLRVGLRVVRELPSAFHVFVGDGPLRDRLELEAAAVSDGRVRLMGAVDDVASVFAAADVLLFASRPDGMEGMPAVVIESSMLGVPSVAYDVAGVSEVVRDGESGVLVEWGDETGLADAAVRLLRSPDLRSSMGDAGRTLAMERFTIERVATQYLELYHSLVR